MFSGIVEGLAAVKGAEDARGGRKMHVDLGKFARGVRPRQSVCISGCCLTVAKISGGVAAFDISPETLRKTYFSDIDEGDKVNVERSLKLGQEIGGHLVSGHVDCVGTISERKDYTDYCEMSIKFPKQFSRLLIDKGSIAVDGISLTVVKAQKGSFSIALIPTTLELTTLGFKRPGDKVNIEFDHVAKYIVKMMQDNKRFARMMGK